MEKLSQILNESKPSYELDETFVYQDHYYNYYELYNDTHAYGRNYSCDHAYNTASSIPGHELCIQILLPILCGFGIIGISLTVIVLSRKNMSTSTNCYLISLALSDLFYLMLVATKWFETKLTGEHSYIYFIVSTYTHEILLAVLLASVWLTVILAVERYIAICHPLRSMSMWTVNRAICISTTTFVISLIYRLPHFFKYKIVSFHDPCIQKSVPWHVLTSLGTNDLFRDIYKWSDCVLLVILPFSALLFLNGCLIREIHRSTNYLRYHLASDSNVQNIITSEEIKITFMLISVVVVFFICEAPYVTLNIVRQLKQEILFNEYRIMSYIVILLLCLRSSFNFIVYCWFSEKFWNTFKQTFCKPQCLLKRAPRWLRYHVNSNASEHGNSNNNRKISNYHTKETFC